MKRLMVISFLLVALSAGYAEAQMGGGMMGAKGQPQPAAAEKQQADQMGPGMMGHGMGPGMMGGGMGMMGPDMMGMGMMGPGMMGPGMMGRGMGMMGRGMMMRGCMSGYGMGAEWGFEDPDKYNKFMDETRELRKKIHDKTFDYFEAERNPKTTMGELMNLEKEIFGLRKELFEKAKKYQQ